MIFLLIAFAGGVGSLLRFIADGLLRTRLGRSFPYGTAIINITGSLLLGLITGLAVHHHLSPSQKLIFGTGLCGGYTTFSTASFETVRLVEDKRLLAGLVNAGGSLALTMLAGAVGLGMIK